MCPTLPPAEYHHVPQIVVILSHITFPNLSFPSHLCPSKFCPSFEWLHTVLPGWPRQSSLCTLCFAYPGVSACSHLPGVAADYMQEGGGEASAQTLEGDRPRFDSVSATVVLGCNLTSWAVSSLICSMEVTASMSRVAGRMQVGCLSFLFLL